MSCTCLAMVKIHRFVPVSKAGQLIESLIRKFTRLVATTAAAATTTVEAFRAKLEFVVCLPLRVLVIAFGSKFELAPNFAS